MPEYSIRCYINDRLRDWSLITGREGGYTTGGRGGGVACEGSFTPMKSVCVCVGRGGSFSHAEGGGGHKQFWGSFFCGSLKL